MQEPSRPRDDWAFVLFAALTFQPLLCSAGLFTGSLKVLHYCIKQMATARTGSLYLTNNVRSVLGLNSVEPAHRVKDKAEAWAAKKGRMIYIQGLGEIGGAPPPPVATLGDCTITGPGVSGDAATWTTGDAHELTAAISGDADPVAYLWSVRSGDCVSIVGAKNKATAQFTCTKAGMATLRCTFTADASDSPKETTISVVVTDPAKQAKSTSRK